MTTTVATMQLCVPHRDGTSQLLHPRLATL
jgi:hypothetical protein